MAEGCLVRCREEGAAGFGGRENSRRGHSWRKARVAGGDRVGDTPSDGHSVPKKIKTPRGERRVRQ